MFFHILINKGDQIYENKTKQKQMGSNYLGKNLKRNHIKNLPTRDPPKKTKLGLCHNITKFSLKK
jgi:hypothetical protein